MTTGTELVTGEVMDADEQGQMVAIDGALALATLNRSEIDMQITTAKKYPRSITTVNRQAMELATLDEETAGTMFYALPRGGKKIEGPSIRLAEVIGSCWGNLRYGSRVVAIDPPGRKGEPQFVTAQGMCHDLEKNVAIAWETKRRITGKDGQRFNEDMIQVTGAAACAIALREAIFKVVPRALIKPIYEAAKLTSIGKAESIGEKRAKMLAHFAKMGVDEEHVLTAVEVKGVDDIGIDELITLRGIATAVKDGDTTVDEAFNPRPAEPAQKVRRSTLNDIDTVLRGMHRALIDEPKKPAEHAKEPESTQPTTWRGLPLSALADQLGVDIMKKLKSTKLATAGELEDAVKSGSVQMPAAEMTRIGDVLVDLEQQALVESEMQQHQA